MPGARESGQESDINERQTASDNADSKLADALNKLKECHSAGNYLLARGAAAKASLRSYLTANAALSVPQNKILDADIELIDLYAPESVVTRCNDLHEKLTGKRL